MKLKLEINSDDQKIVKIATKTIKDDYTLIEYRETPTNKTSLEVYPDKIKVTKTGAVNLCFTHKVKESKRLDYIVKLEGKSFEGSSKIKTVKYEVTDKAITLEYNRDGERVKQSWISLG